jgi:uncharacterized protein YvpB
MDTLSFTNLGGLEKTPDVRDIPLGAITSPHYTFPASLRNEYAWSSIVEYQGQQPACGAHAGTKIGGLSRNSRFSPRTTWANLKSFDGWAIEDGTDMRSIFKSIHNFGLGSFNLMGNDIGLSLQDYAHPTMTPQIVTDANSQKAGGYGFITDNTFDGLKQYIHEHGPVILLIRVGPEFWTAPNGVASWREADILPLRNPSRIVSGHFVVAHSFDENYIYFINSWSDRWGREGHGYFGPNYMPWVIDGGALVTLAFNKDLSFGMTDPQVKTLQTILNKNPLTQVARSGPGSPGVETTYFGGLTKTAVMKFQKLHNIQPALGYVGPLTRAVLNINS